MSSSVLDVLMRATPTCFTVCSYLSEVEILHTFLVLCKPLHVSKKYDAFRAILCNRGYSEAAIEQIFFAHDVINKELLAHTLSGVFSAVFSNSDPTPSLASATFGALPSHSTFSQQFLSTLEYFEEECALLRHWCTQNWPPCIHCGRMPAPQHDDHYVCFHDGYGVCKDCFKDNAHPPSHVVVWVNKFLPLDQQHLQHSAYWDLLFECHIRKVRCDTCRKKKHDFLVHIPDEQLYASPETIEDDGQLVCDGCLDTSAFDGSYYYVRALPETVYSAEAAPLIRRGVWCDHCGVSVVGRSYKSISVPDFDLCEECALSRTDEDWQHESHAGFLVLQRSGFESMNPRPRDDHPVVPSDASDVQWWATQQFIGYNAPKVLSCSLKETAFLQCFDFTQGQYVGVRATFTTSRPGEWSYSAEKRAAVNAAIVSMQQVEHPNVLQLLHYAANDVADGEQTLRYCVFPYVEAGSLENVLTGAHHHICNENHVQSYIRQVLQGVQALHQQGVVHGNLQTRTCLVDSAGNVRVAYPLGMWRLLYGVTGDEETDPKAFQRVNTICNCATVHFLAPEVAQGHPRTTASDVYAIGAIMSNLISSRPLCDQWNDTSEALVAYIAEHPSYPQPKFLQKDDGVAFSQSGGPAVCRRMLAVDPAQRPSIEELLNEPYFSDG